MWWALSLAGAVVLAACGSGGSSGGDGNVRMINLTRAHSSLDLLVASVRSIGGVGTNTASTYVAVGSGANSLQVTDAGTQTALVTTAPSVAKDQYYSLLVYESNSVLKTAWLAENDTAPGAGTSNFRIFNVAPDAGSLDVYVTAPTVDLATVAAPTFTVSGAGTSQITTYLSFTPGTYRVRVTASGNTSDLRLDVPSVALGDQGLTTLVLAPTNGGGLVDGAVLAQRAAFTAFQNTNARVRVVSGVPSALVRATAGSTVVEPGAIQPNGAYVTVPSGSATWAVTVAGNAAAVPPITLVAGSDNTLLVTGTSAAASARMLDDDNHAPTVSSNVKLRLVNGVSAGSVGLSMSIDFALAASNVTPGTASIYKTVSGSTNMRLEVDSPISSTPISLQTGLNVPGGGVYTVFVLGDSNSPVTSVRKDR
jgi:hypothetical protein